MAPHSSQPVVSTSEVFQSYEDDLRMLLDQLRSLAKVAEGDGSSSERAAAGQDMTEAHEKASQALQQMEFEVKSMGSLGASLSGKLKEHRQELLACRALVRNVQAKLHREGLKPATASRSAEEEKSMGDSFNRLRAGSRRLDESRRTALEAEELGLNVMSDLHGQRESIMRTKGHLGEVDDHLSTTKQFLTSLARRSQGNQAMVWCLALVLFITLVFLIYLKLQKLITFLR
eukprot:TRINITY_DN80758_c0_g1_i1.p1 TRINITY_DN80758_c0_g1~~TRINITY_DN80758_c0_g1_i1.p1  ORF type:complete len:244 (+),score=59.89 TRINITY_DN80758_c0_g1_i1:42-734(+)